MNEINKRNLLSAVCVFSFVAFAFAIAQTFGNTYAYTDDDCPSGWTYTSGHANVNNVCKKEFDFGDPDDNQQSCNSAITGLGLEIDYSGLAGDRPGDTVNYCTTYETTGIYTAYISLEDYLEANPPYRITFNPSGGYMLSSEIINVTKGKTFTLPTKDGVTKGSYTLDGWTTDADDCDSHFEPGATRTAYGDITYYACWTTTLYTVEFRSLTNDYLQNPVLLKNGDKVSNPTIDELTSDQFNLSNYSADSDNYRFTHWSYGKCGDAADTISGTITLKEETTYIHACWTAKSTGGNTGDTGDAGNDDEEEEPQTFTATFDANGGTLKGSRTKDCDTTSTSCRITSLPTAELEGFLFMGWGTKSSCTEGSTSSITLTEDDTFYACWVEDTGNEYTVTFNTNGGSLYVNGNKTSTTKYTLTSLNYANYKAQKEGSKFTGWRTNTTTCDDAKTSGTIQLTANLSLVACYEAESGGVTENPNTGSSLLYVVYLIGILALGYTGYYAYKTIKVKK